MLHTGTAHSELAHMWPPNRVVLFWQSTSGRDMLPCSQSPNHLQDSPCIPRSCWGLSEEAGTPGEPCLAPYLHAGLGVSHHR